MLAPAKTPESAPSAFHAGELPPRPPTPVTVRSRSCLTSARLPSRRPPLQLLLLSLPPRPPSPRHISYSFLKKKMRVEDKHAESSECFLPPTWLLGPGGSTQFCPQCRTLYSGSSAPTENYEELVSLMPEVQ
nr:hypothetical protein Iba_chr02cCG11690 [Ipomoea batatas]